MITYDLSKFSTKPFGRYVKDGKFNGTTFREILSVKLKEAQSENDYLIVDLDNIEFGVGSSFLEEAFGGLVRKGLFTKDELIGSQGILQIKSQQAFYKEEIHQYIDEAKKENNQGS